MSLLRLLTAGKSLIGAKDAASRYHLGSQGMLPKFGSKKNPFRGSARAELTEPETGNHPAPVETAAGDSSEVSLPSTSPAPESSASKLEPGGFRRPGWTKRCLANLRSLVKLGRHKAARAAKPTPGAPRPAPGSEGAKSARRATWFLGRSARPSIPPFAKPMVQGELSLDRVKVVRNDLSDTDLEVVPGKPVPGNGSSTPEAPGKRALPEPVQPGEIGTAGGLGRNDKISGTAFSRVAGRLFGAGKG